MNKKNNYIWTLRTESEDLFKEKINLIYEYIKNNIALLINPNWDILLWEEIKNLDNPIQDKSVYLELSHWAVVPFIARATKDKCVPGNWNTFLVDAHFDDLDSDSIRSSLLNFMKCTNKDAEMRLFQELLDWTIKDIQCFIHALQNISFDFIAHYVEDVQSNRKLSSQSLISPEKYLLADKFYQNQFHTNLSLQDIATRNPIHIWLIDSDIVGCSDEENSFSDKVTNFNRVMKNIIEALTINYNKFNDKSIYTISLDKEYCLFPKEFLEHFFCEFYREKILWLDKIKVPEMCIYEKINTSSYIRKFISTLTRRNT